MIAYLALNAFSLVAVGILVLGACVLLLLARPLTGHATATAIVGALFAVVAAGVGVAFSAVGGLAVAALCVVAILALLLTTTLAPEIQERAHVPEAAALLLLGTAGAVALAFSTDLVQAVVGLETLALSAVTLVALGQGERSLEAAFKYFVLGAIALAVLLYGVGLVYLGAGSFAFPTAALVTENGLVLAGVVLIALAFAFELAVVPFHWGALDAYTAAPPALAGWVMSASKLAAAFALGKLVLAAGLPVGQVLVWLGALTILWGTFGALAQRELRRLLAYSAVTHAGFIALAAGSGPEGTVAAAFYAALYGAMAMLVFASLAGRGTEGVPVAGVTTDTLGPVRASALALGLFSLSGIPPTPGFWAKLAVLAVAWQGAGIIPTLIAVAGGVFSVLYYLRPLPDLFAAVRAGLPLEPEAAARLRFAQTRALPAVALAAVLVVGLSIFPNVAWTLLR